MIIDNLSKVTIEAEIIKPLFSGTGDDAPLRIEFIFGIASGGPSSFERELYKKSPADVVCISVPKAAAVEYFGHVYQHLCRLFGAISETEIFALQVTVVTVQKSQEREIIKAMSRSIGHSCGGSGCECGCS